MITKLGEGTVGNAVGAAQGAAQSVIPAGVNKAVSGVGKVLGGAFTYGFPVYQYLSGEESIGGAVGSMAGGSLGASLGGKLGNTAGKPLSVLGRTLRRSNSLPAKAIGHLLNFTGKGVGVAGSLAGGFLGFDVGSKAGNKIMPIHKRSMEPDMPEPMLPQPMMYPQVKQASLAGVARAVPGVANSATRAAELSPTLARYLFHGGGLAAAALAAYYGNKNFNEDKAALARMRTLRAQSGSHMYPTQFYNVQQ